MRKALPDPSCTRCRSICSRVAPSARVSITCCDQILSNIVAGSAMACSLFRRRRLLHRCRGLGTEALADRVPLLGADTAEGIAHRHRRIEYGMPTPRLQLPQHGVADANDRLE